MSESSGKPGRYQRSSNGLLASMGILVVGLLAFVALRSFVFSTPDGGAAAVDYAPVASQARQAGLVAPAPVPLPKGWKATSVRFTPPDASTKGASGSWHLGLLTDEQRYVAVEETASADVDDLLPDTVDNATRSTPVRIDGRTWRSWTGTDGAYALATSVTGGRDVLVASPAGRTLVRDVIGRVSLPTPTT